MTMWEEVLDHWWEIAHSRCKILNSQSSPLSDDTAPTTGCPTAGQTSPRGGRAASCPDTTQANAGLANFSSKKKIDKDIAEDAGIVARIQELVMSSSEEGEEPMGHHTLLRLTACRRHSSQLSIWPHFSKQYRAFPTRTNLTTIDKSFGKNSWERRCNLHIKTILLGHWLLHRPSWQRAIQTIYRKALKGVSHDLLGKVVALWALELVSGLEHRNVAPVLEMLHNTSRDAVHCSCYYQIWHVSLTTSAIEAWQKGQQAKLTNFASTDGVSLSFLFTREVYVYPQHMVAKTLIAVDPNIKETVAVIVPHLSFKQDQNMKQPQSPPPQTLPISDVTTPTNCAGTPVAGRRHLQRRRPDCKKPFHVALLKRGGDPAGFTTARVAQAKIQHNIPQKQPPHLCIHLRRGAREDVAAVPRGAPSKHILLPHPPSQQHTPCLCPPPKRDRFNIGFKRALWHSGVWFVPINKCNFSQVDSFTLLDHLIEVPKMNGKGELVKDLVKKLQALHYSYTDFGCRIHRHVKSNWKAWNNAVFHKILENPYPLGDSLSRPSFHPLLGDSTLTLPQHTSSMTPEPLQTPTTAPSNPSSKATNTLL
ncbi:hypothetical protein BDK51DRAFT_28101, partial [Blyttiomyces helicus]